MITVGSIVRTSYGTGPYRVIEIERGCTCPDYIDSINLHDKAPPRLPHMHLVVVPVNVPIGEETKNDWRWLSGYYEAEDGTYPSRRPDIPGACIEHDELFCDGVIPGTQTRLFD